MSHPPLRLRLFYLLSVACCGSSVHKTGCSLYIYLHYTQRIYTQSLRTRPITSIARTHLSIFPRCICTRGPLANRRAGLLRLAVSPASLRGWRRRRLTPSPYIFHYILPHMQRLLFDLIHCKPRRPGREKQTISL